MLSLVCVCVWVCVCSSQLYCKKKTSSFEWVHVTWYWHALLYEGKKVNEKYLMILEEIAKGKKKRTIENKKKYFRKEFLSGCRDVMNGLRLELLEWEFIYRKDKQFHWILVTKLTHTRSPNLIQSPFFFFKKKGERKRKGEKFDVSQWKHDVEILQRKISTHE